MAFPESAAFTTDDLDAGTDSPNAARAQLYIALNQLTEIIDSQNLPLGIVILTAEGLVPLDRMPFVPLSGETVPISKGGTGATNAADARANLGLADGLTFDEGAPIYFGDPANNNYFTFDGSSFRFFIGGVDVGGFGD